VPINGRKVIYIGARENTAFRIQYPAMLLRGKRVDNYSFNQGVSFLSWKSKALTP
jgi:hypothetical protein